MKRTPLKKKSRKANKNTKEKQERTEELIGLYKEIWREREHKDFETGLLLLGEPRTYNFHHVLPKSQFPQYAKERWNIVLVSWHTHDQVEMDMDKCPKIKALYERLLKSAKSFKEKFDLTYMLIANGLT
jgi:hypothetical protein